MMRQRVANVRRPAAVLPVATAVATVRHVAGWSFFRAALSGTSSASADERGRVLSKSWLAAVKGKNPQWTDCFAETVTEEWVADRSARTNATRLRDFGADDEDDDLPQTVATQSSKILEQRGGVEQFALAVSDDVDVAGFACRYGLKATMIHRLSQEDHPLVGWLRRHGATVIGKLQNTMPFALNESTYFEHSPGAAAVTCGACDVAVVTTIYGVGGANAPVVEDTVSFTPSKTTFPRGTPPFSRFRSMGFIFRDLASLSSFWSEIAGDSTVAISKPQSVAATGLRTSALDEDQSTAMDPIARHSSSASHLHHANHHLSGISTSGVEGGLIVGIPAGWIDACFASADVEDAGSQFLTAYREQAQKRLDRRGAAKLRCEGRAVEVKRLSWTASPDDVYDCARTIAHFELAEALQKAGPAFAGTGLLEQLPRGVLNAIYEGRNIARGEYEMAVAAKAEIAQEFIEEAGEVDCVAMPLVCPPMQSNNLRSSAVTLPVGLSGCPSLSLRVHLPGFAPLGVKPPLRFGDYSPMMIAAEPGMDSALIDIVNDFFR